MSMFKYVIKRILLMVFTLFVIMSICFVLIKLLPLPVVTGSEATIQRVEATREAMGYYDPIIVQYFAFWKRILTEWNWGYGENMYAMNYVTDVIAARLPATITVNLLSLLVSVPIGLGLGIFAAIQKNKLPDHIISVLVMVFISVPSFVYAFLVQYIFCYRLGWFPILVNDLVYDIADFSVWDLFGQMFAPSMVYTLIPAILSLSFGTVAGLTRYTRAELSEVLTGDYMLLARTKGLTRRQATIRHALRNAMVPIFPMILGEFISIMSGSLIIEGIFNIPGVGSLYITSVNMLDYNFFMALTAFYTAIGLAAGLVIDLSYGFIDPRIRMGAR